MSASTREEVLAAILAKRGYILDFHRQMASADPGFMQAYETFLGAAYTDERVLARRDKELVYIGALVGLGAESDHIAAHLRVAKDHGISEQELLEVIEMCIPSCGVPKFMKAFEAWWGLFGNDEDAAPS